MLSIERALIQSALIAQLRRIMYDKLADDDAYAYQARRLARKLAGDLAINSYLSYTATMRLLSDD